MQGEECQELAQVALIGLDRVGSDPAFGGEMRQPGPALAGKPIGAIDRIESPMVRQMPCSAGGYPEAIYQASAQPIFWPVFAQSARKASRPLSVSGCL